MKSISLTRVKELLDRIKNVRALVVGDIMLDEFVWGKVSRISPEAPVPVVEFMKESFMPGGAANVARNVAALRGMAEIFGVIGKDDAGQLVRKLLIEQGVDCEGIIESKNRPTSTKTRIIAQHQQVVRLDREIKSDLDKAEKDQLMSRIQKGLNLADAVIICDYGKGVVTQELLDWLRGECRPRAIWLSLDPKPVHHLVINRLSLITPNRKEAFELAGMTDSSGDIEPLRDNKLLEVAKRLITDLSPAILLITLGEQGMLLCRRGQHPFHVPTVAREVFDVSGAGDTVIASFTLAIAAGASPIEATVFSNHAAGVVVGKLGTAVVTPDEIVESFKSISK